MKDLISTMFRLPMAMAQLGADQLQQMLDRDRDGQYTRDPETYPNGNDYPANDLFATMMDTGQRMMRGMAKGVRDTPAETDSYRDGGADEFSASASGPGTATAEQRRHADVPFPTATRPSPATRSQPQVHPADFGRLDVSTMVVIGEGLAAGLGDFSLSSDSQQMSFPAQLARHFGADFRQPLFEPPGIPASATCQSSSLRVPDLKQTTVLQEYPPSSFGNLSIPGFSIRDCLQLRPRLPLVHQDDAKQTLANMILDPHALIKGGSEHKLRTQLECAIGRCPTTAILALGFNDILEPALRGKSGELPPITEQRRYFAAILKALEETKADVLVLNVPDPLDTACFSTLDAAAPRNSTCSDGTGVPICFAAG